MDANSSTFESHEFTLISLSLPLGQLYLSGKKSDADQDREIWGENTLSQRAVQACPEAHHHVSPPGNTQFMTAGVNSFGSDISLKITSIHATGKLNH